MQQELEEEKANKEYDEELYQILVVNNTPIEPTEVLYIATTSAYSKKNYFKAGGTQSTSHLNGRLSTYNTGAIQGDEFFYTNTYLVCNFREMEKRIESLLDRFQNKKSREIYVIHYDDLIYVIEYIISHANDEINEINEKLSIFISNLNRRNKKPAVVKPLVLTPIQERSQATPWYTKIENVILTLDLDTEVVNAKHIFDFLKIKTGRRELYPILVEIIATHLPRAKMVKY